MTGSSRGLGRAIAMRLAAEGADVAIHDRDAASAAEFGESRDPEETVRAVRDLGRRSMFVAADVGDSASVNRMAEEVVRSLGRIDLLVNAAGGDIGAGGGKPEPNDLLGVPEADLRAILDRNLMGTVFCCRAVAPGMVGRGEGRIVNIASVAGEAACAYGSPYAVAKAAIIHFTRCLAAELRPAGINVNCISPGATVTARFMATRPVAPERLAETGRLTRLGRPSDVAGVALFLCSDLAEFVHGQTIRVDGGART